MKSHKPVIWELNILTFQISMSKDFCSLLNTPFSNKSIQLELFINEYVFLDDHILFHDTIKTFIASDYEFGKTLQFEYRMIDSSINTMDVSTTIYRSAEDKITAYTINVSGYDEQDRKLKDANERLLSLNQKLKGIIDNTDSAVAIYRAISNGEDFLFTFFNQAAEKFEKIKNNDIIGKRLLEVFPKADEFGILDVLKRVWRTGKPESHPLSWYQDGRVSGWRKNYVFKIASGEVVAIYNDFSELKLSELSLKKFKVAVEQSANSIVITNLDGDIEYANSKFLNLYGYTLKEAVGENPRILKSGHQLDSYYVDMWYQLKQGKVWTGLFHNKTKNGKFVWVNATISPVFDDKKNIVNYIGIQEDITEKKKTEDALIASENKMRSIFNAMDDAVFEMNDQGIYTYIAPTNTGLLYLEPESLIGKSLHDIFPKSQADLFHNFIIESLKVGETIIKEYFLEIDNEPIWFEGRITPKNKTEVTFITRNITKRRRTQEKLIKSESKFRTLFEKSSDAILLIRNGKFVDCNHAAVEMLEYKSKDFLLFKNPRDISPSYQDDGESSESKARKMMKLCLEKGSHKFEWYHQKADGKIFPVEVLLTTIENDSGEILLHVVWRDITVRKQEEKELLKAKEKAERADKFKSAFLANMSHEIRTPMNGILGFTELLQEDGISPEEKNHFLEIIRRSGMNMLNIINDILDISKVESGEMELNLVEHNITETLDYLFNFFKPEIAKKDLKWTKEYNPDKKVMITVDQFKINELITNLIKNAIKYTHEGTVSMGLMEDDQKIEIFIKDTGIGIPYEKQDQIFERFIQADNDITHMVYGTGLGLALAKAYVELHKGNIWLESAPGKGSTFYFCIPKNLEI